jgi:hypothetical protein
LERSRTKTREEPNLRDVGSVADAHWVVRTLTGRVRRSAADSPCSREAALP